MPIGSETSIHSTAPPSTREAVTGAASADDLVHLLPRRERGAERGPLEPPARVVAGTTRDLLLPHRREPVQEARVLNVDGLVRAEEALSALDVLLRGGLAGDKGGRVGRNHEEDHERDHGHADEEEECPEESADQKSEHLCSTTAVLGKSLEAA